MNLRITQACLVVFVLSWIPACGKRPAPKADEPPPAAIQAPRTDDPFKNAAVDSPPTVAASKTLEPDTKAALPKVVSEDDSKDDVGAEGLTIDGELTEASTKNSVGRPAHKHSIKFAAGQTYLITLNSKAFDTFVTVYKDKAKLAFDDDGGEGLNSRLIFRATDAGEYAIEACAYDKKLGPYRLAIEHTKEAPLAKNQKAGPPKGVLGRTGPPKGPPMGPPKGPQGFPFKALPSPTGEDQIYQGFLHHASPRQEALTPLPFGTPKSVLDNRHVINLEAQTTYTFFIESSHFLPALILIGPKGQTLANNTSYGQSTFALIQVTPPTRGACSLVIQSSQPGNYELRYRAGEKSELESARVAARQLANAARAKIAAREYADADESTQKALAALETLYTGAVYPQGHPELATLLCESGYVKVLTGDIKEGLLRCQRGLTMHEDYFKDNRQLMGRHFRGNSYVVSARASIAAGEYVRAKDELERGVHFMDGAAAGPIQSIYARVALLNELGSVYEQIGDYRMAMTSYVKAMGGIEKVRDPFERGPAEASIGRMYLKHGNPQKAFERLERGYAEMRRVMRTRIRIEMVQAALTLGELQNAVGADTKEKNFLAEADDLARTLYPVEKFPQGHWLIIQTQTALARSLFRTDGRKAIEMLEKAHAMAEQLRSADKFPKGHPELARCLDQLGLAYFASGDPAKGLRTIEASLAMREKLHPDTQYAKGHPELISSWTHRSLLLEATGKSSAALEAAQNAWAMRNRFAQAYLDRAGEGSALAFLRDHARCKDVALSLTSDSEKSPNVALYAQLWLDKAWVTRLLERRKAASRLALKLALEDKNSALAKNVENLRIALGQLHAATVHPDLDETERERRIASAKTQKDDLERNIRDLTNQTLNDQRFLPPEDRSTWRDLVDALPAGSAFLDFVRYQQFQQGKPGTYRYAVFVIPARGQLTRVELGDAKSIDEAIIRWRRAIEAGEVSLAYVKDRGIKRVAPTGKENESVALELSKKLWAPIAAKLPAGTKTIWIAPDGDLARLPFAALPNAKADGVLLEEFQFAQVPHGPFLVRHLNAAPEKSASRRDLLAVGGVSYGKGWPFLEGTRREIDQILALTKDKSALSLTGNEASPERLIVELPGSRIVHLATHGYFDESALSEERSRDAGRLKTWQYGTGSRAGLGARHPLAFSGLVLSGAQNDDAKGILTADALVDLPLDGTRLAVLSACETGLGEFTEGEGVQGLSRAFHLAGSANVVVSLWKVSDAATAALMCKFYHEMLAHGKSPLDALHVAQLTIYRRPDLIPVLSGERGRAEQDQALRSRDIPASTTQRAATRLWTPFFLSGVGR